MSSDRITVTASGMHGILISMQAVLEAGDNAVLVGPLWPNAEATARVAGAEPRVVALDNENGVWQRSHFLNTAQTALQFFLLAFETQHFFFDQVFESAVTLHLLKLLEALDRLLDRLEIR